MPEYHWVTPQEWYQSLDSETRKVADQKMEILKKFNADDPLGWVSSEMRENIPQVARFLFLHRVRSEVLDGYFQFQFTAPEQAELEKSLSPLERLHVGTEAYNRLLESGVDRDDLVRVARAAACRATLNFVEMLDGVTLPDEFENLNNAPDWALMEIIEENGERKLTGRVLDGLHESVCDLYPTDN